MATLTGAMCNTSQYGLRSFRLNSGMLNGNSHCVVLHITPIRVANLVLDCNGNFAIKAYRPLSRRLDRYGVFAIYCSSVNNTSVLRFVIVMTRAATGSQLVHQLVYTGNYADPSTNVTWLKTGVHILVVFFGLPEEGGENYSYYQ